MCLSLAQQKIANLMLMTLLVKMVHIPMGLPNAGQMAGSPLLDIKQTLT